MTDLEQPRLNAVIEVGGQVSNLVGEVDQLRLERRPLVEKILRQLRMLLDVVVARVLDDALAHAERQVQSAMRGVALLKVLDDAQRMQVVVEAPSMAT